MELRYNVLSKREREKLLTILYGERNIEKNFTLLPEELKRIERFGKPHWKLGYAIQLLFLKNRGVSIISNKELLSPKIVEYVANQIGCISDCLQRYWDVKNIRFNHFQEICNILEFKKFEETSKIETFIYNKVLSIGEPIEVMENLIEELRKIKVVVPALYKLEELIYKGINATEKFIFSKICEQIDDKNKLENLFLVENGVSNYSILKNISVNNTPSGVKILLETIKTIDSYGKIIDLSFLTDSKIRYFYTEIQRSHRFRIERFSNLEKKYSYLAMFLSFKRREFVDMVIETTSNYAHTVMKRTKKKSQNYNQKNQERYKLNSGKLKDVVEYILQIKDIPTLKEYQSSLTELKKELDSTEEELEEIDFLLKSHQSFNYTNELLECIEFDSNTKPNFINYLKSFKENKNKKKFKADISFFSSQWQKNIKKYDYSKKVVEIALLYSIRDYIRSGDIFVRESKKYNSFDHYLVDSIDEIIPDEIEIFIKTLKSNLIIPKKLDFQRIIEQDSKSNFGEKIYSYFPKITMTEILYEVNSWTGVLEHFYGASKSPENRQNVAVATLLANGHNIGFSKMAISASIDESILKRANEFYFNYSNLFKAQQCLVNYHHTLEIVENWGDGKTSSSDGMRVPISSKTIYADYNAHYGNRGGGIYRHISDQYTPYYVQMLQGRDSNHVLDGLLYHGTELEIYEHSTDTAGYTEQMFALTHLLGFNFKPRIKNLDQQQLYAFETLEIDDIKFKKINEKIILENYFEVMRLVESIKCGKVKASLILQKINSYNRDNGVAKGLKEIGRIFKTKYILDYYTDMKLRKEVQKIFK